MSRITRTIAVATLLAATPIPALAASPAASGHAPAKLAQACAGREGWADAAPPARIFGNTWYVGTCGISAILVTGDDGHVLIDGGVAKAAPLVLKNIATLGFKARDIRWIVASHEHHDHVGALAALRRATGARVAALPAQKAVLETGRMDRADPQFSRLDAIAPVKVDRTLADGDSIVVGRLALTAHATPAHAMGSTSWTWQSCTADLTCRMIAYADSASTISADGYRFSAHPQRIAEANTGLRTIAALPCDVLLTPHPSASRMMERFAGKGAIVDPAACRSYASDAQAKFKARLAKEAGEAR